VAEFEVDRLGLRSTGGSVGLEAASGVGARIRGETLLRIPGTKTASDIGQAVYVLPGTSGPSVRCTSFQHGSGPWALELDLPSSEPARVELLAVNGRRLTSTNLTPAAPGRRSIALAPPPRLSAG